MKVLVKKNQTNSQLIFHFDALLFNYTFLIFFFFYIILFHFPKTEPLFFTHISLVAACVWFCSGAQSMLSKYS